MTDVWLNDVPIENFLCAVTSLGNWLATTTFTVPTVQIPGSLGFLFNATGITGAPRQLPIGVYFTPASVATRKASLVALLDQCRGLVRIRANDAPTRFVEAMLMSQSSQVYGPDFVNAPADLLLNFTSVSNVAWERDPSSVSISSGVDTDVSAVLGSVPSRGLLQLTGIATTATLTFKNRSGITLSTMTLTGTLGAGEYLIVNGFTQTISRVTGSTVVDAFTWKGSTDQFPLFDPADGPLVNCTGCAGQLFARKGYLL